MLRTRRSYRAAAAHAEFIRSELQTLLPHLRDSLPSLTSTMSVAAIIAATAHAKTLASDAAQHSPTCAVRGQRAPLMSLVGVAATVTSATSSRTPLCSVCMRQRVHDLASMLFCADMEQRCRRTSVEANAVAEEYTATVAAAASVHDNSSTALLSAVQQRYASMSALEDEVVLFAKSAQTPGRTWLVYTVPPSAPPPFSSSSLSAASATAAMQAEDDMDNIKAIKGGSNNNSGSGSSSSSSGNSDDGSSASSRNSTPAGHVAIINLTGHMVPLVWGLWPLAVVDMTEQRLCRATLSLAASVTTTAVSSTATTPPPRWSRAARNPCVASAYESAAMTAARVDGGVTELANVTLDTVREYVARSAMRRMSWTFVAQQLVAAQSYYNAAQRAHAQAARLKREKAVAIGRALQQLRTQEEHVTSADGNGNVSGSDGSRQGTDTGTTTTTTTTTDGGAVTDTSSQRPSHSGTDTAATTTTATAAAAAATGEHEETCGTTSETATAATANAEPTVVQHDDGTWEYRYANGEVTYAYANGTRLFVTAHVRTTVYTDGATLYEYANNTSILDRADGMRVTTFADGTTREERRQPTPSV